MVWEIVLGLAGVVGYYVLRYQRDGKFTFPEYLRWELVTLAKGTVGFFLLYGAWSAFNPIAEWLYIFTDFNIPSIPDMNAPMAVVIGFAAKKIGDYSIGRLAKLEP